MRNCWTVFRNDWKSLGKNAISWVVVVGLVVIPSLYGWFCIYAFWDPYGHTENLKVAVACEDEGYDSSLVPLNINIGKEVREELRENHQLSWMFVEREQALEGVRSGTYYAALLIPKEFTRNLLSILSDEVRPAELQFYLNEKENAIAAKVTNKGAGTVQKIIDEAVAEKASEITLSVLGTVTDALDGQDAEYLTDNLMAALRRMKEGLFSAADTLDALCAMNATLDSLLDSTGHLLREIGENTNISAEKAPSDILFDANDGLMALKGKLDAVLQRTDAAYAAIDRAAAEFLQDMDANAEDAGEALTVSAQQIDMVIQRYYALQTNVNTLAEALPSQLDYSRQLLNRFSVSLDRSIRQQTQIRDALTEVASALTEISSDAVQDRRDLSAGIAGCRQLLEDLRSNNQKELQPQLQALTASMTEIETSVQGAADALGSAVTRIRDVTDSTEQQFAQLDQTLEDTRDLLRDAAGKLDRLLTRSSEGDSPGQILDNLLRSDPGTVSSYFSSIVSLDEHVIYPVSNFGSAMAPFYTSLAIWFGSIVLVAMLKVDISDRLAASLTRPRNWQLYLGRYGIFLVLGLFQCLLLALGDLFFLGVTCAHPGWFVLTCLYTGFVFVTIVYTLTASFGNIGKALAVILMVFQVAGSGGTIPIEMTPPFFHRFYPLLPLTHSMTAMRECVGGMYEHSLLTEYGILAVYVGISWILGLVLRNPMIRMNHFLEENLEETKVM